MSVSTRELINLTCFEKLFVMYRIKLFNFSYTQLRSREDAEEVVQDAFVKIWENRAMLNEELSFSSCLFTIAKNLIINKVRRKVAEPAAYETVGEHSAQDDSTQNDIIYRDITSVAQRAIQTLPATPACLHLSRRDFKTKPS